MRAVVLGHNGMLGHVVARYLREHHCEVATLASRFIPHRSDEFLREITTIRPDLCVNCVGVAPGRGASPEQLQAANEALPIACARLVREGIGVVHASSDGVFNTQQEARAWSEVPDATDEYGLQKIAAEKALRAAGATVIRCSIIGPELSGAKSLLQWVLTRTEAIPGYANHFWNGLTTLEWAKLAFAAMNGDKSVVKGEDLLQPGFVPAVSKYDVIRLIVEEWKRPTPVLKVEAKTSVRRWLAPNVNVQPLKNQLNELHRWY